MERTCLHGDYIECTIKGYDGKNLINFDYCKHYTPETKFRIKCTGFLQPRQIQIAGVFKDFSWTLLYPQTMCNRFLIQNSFLKPVRNSLIKYTEMITFPLNEHMKAFSCTNSQQATLATSSSNLILLKENSTILSLPENIQVYREITTVICEKHLYSLVEQHRQHHLCSLLWQVCDEKNLVGWLLWYGTESWCGGGSWRWCRGCC